MIETVRLRLRPWREEEGAAFAAAFNTPAVMRWLGGVRSPDAIATLLDKRLADQARDGFSYWAVQRREDNALVGTCGVRLGRNYPGTSIEGLHELGWRIAEPYWCNGYAREAATATLAWTWSNTAAPLVAAWTTIANVPSWRLMERLGMARRPERDFHRADLPPDDPQAALIVYTLDRPA